MNIITHKLFLPAVALTLLLVGCNTTTFSAVKSDGTKVQITNRRFLWTTDGYVATLSTNGASLSATKSSVDSAAIAAAVSGALEAAAKAAGK